MPIRKRDSYKNRFDPNKYACRLRIVEPAWRESANDSDVACDEDECYAKHDQESDLIRDQISHVQEKPFDVASSETADQYMIAIKTLNESLPKMNNLINWAYDNLPSQALIEEDEDLF